MGDFSSRIGKTSNLDEYIGQYGEETNNKNGAEMLKLNRRDEDVA